MDTTINVGMMYFAMVYVGCFSGFWAKRSQIHPSPSLKRKCLPSRTMSTMRPHEKLLGNSFVQLFQFRF